MSGVAVGVGIGAAALLGAGAGIAGAAINANSADQARKEYATQAEADRAQQAAAQQAALAAQQPYAQAGMGGVSGLGQYQEAGTDALAMQRALAGLDGPEAYQAALAQIESGPQFAAMYQQTENALLQNASATGGLRGGDIQGALAQMRPQILAQLVNQQFGQLGGLAGAGQSAAGGLAQLGQGAAAGQAATGIQGSQMLSQLLQSLGVSNANSTMAQGQAWSQGLNNAAGSIAGGVGGIAGYQSSLTPKL